MNNQIYDYPIQLYCGSKAADNVPHELFFSASKAPVCFIERRKAGRRSLLRLFNQAATLPVAVVEIDLTEPDPFPDDALRRLIDELHADAFLVYGSGFFYRFLLQRLDESPALLTRPLRLLWIIQKTADFTTALRLIALKQKQLQSGRVDTRTVFIDPQWLQLNRYDEGLLLQLIDDFTSPLIRDSAASVIALSFAQGALNCAAAAAALPPSPKKTLLFEAFFLAFSAVSVWGQAETLASHFNEAVSPDTLYSKMQRLAPAACFQPNHFEFLTHVRSLFGLQALNAVPAELKRLGASRPMVLATPSILKHRLTDLFIRAFPPEMSVGVLESDVPQDSDFKRVMELADSYRAHHCDSIIVVGGGSYLDTAKGVNILVSENSNQLDLFDGSYVFTHPLKPLIAVPTTSGTGSEVTTVSMIENQEKKQKHCFISPALLPNTAVLDPRMTLTLPPALTAATGMDALTHAVESFYSLAANPVSACLAWNAVKLIFSHLETAVRNPSDAEARLQLAVASHIAGLAFSNSMVSMVHTLGHVAGAAAHIGHGTCMAVLLPYGLEYNLHKRSQAIAQLLKAIRPECTYPTETEAALAFIREIRDLNQRLWEATDGRHARCFREVVDKAGRPLFPHSQIPAIAKASQNDGSIVYNPEQLSVAEAAAVLEAAWEGTPLNRSLIKKGHQK